MYMYLRKCFAASALLGALYALYPSICSAAEFRVTPIAIIFSRGARTDIVNVINTGDEELRVRISASEWMQDESGKDRYEETGDLIFFPRFMVVGKKETRVIRVGVKRPSSERERTYRLFVEEVPVEKERAGTTVVLNIRFGIPVFVKPVREVVKGELEDIEVQGGVFKAVVRNSGNVHFVIRSVGIYGEDMLGERVFDRELGGWYLLNGVSRQYSVSIPADICRRLKVMRVSVSTDRFSLDGRLDVDKSMCSP